MIQVIHSMLTGAVNALLDSNNLRQNAVSTYNVNSEFLTHGRATRAVYSTAIREGRSQQTRD